MLCKPTVLPTSHIHVSVSLGSSVSRGSSGEQRSCQVHCMHLGYMVAEPARPPHADDRTSWTHRSFACLACSAKKRCMHLPCDAMSHRRNFYTRLGIVQLNCSSTSRSDSVARLFKNVVGEQLLQREVTSGNALVRHGCSRYLIRI